MGKVFARLVVMLSSVTAYADESWFDGHWILDREATFAAWADATEARIVRNAEQPEEEFVGLTAEGIRASIEHALEVSERSTLALWDAQGEPELKVDSGTIALRFRERWSEREPYSLRPIQVGVFEVMGSVEGEQWKSVVRKTETGFCRATHGPYAATLRSDAIVYSQECFKRHDA